jgi:hypothetical protein
MMWYVEENAVEEFGAVGRTKLTFRRLKAFTVLLMGILALGARYTPVVHTDGINPLSDLLNSPFTRLMAIVLHHNICLYLCRPCTY